MTNSIETTGLIGDTPYFSEVNAVWPDLANQRVNLAPPRNGMDRFTGKMIHGWDHVEQSMELIFATPFHERVLRRWVGSFVPMILGENAVSRVITRFYWAIATAIDLWEPNYRIKQVSYMGAALNSPANTVTDPMVDEFRLGHAIFRQEGVYRPRAHLGDFTPYERRGYNYVGRGGQFWDVQPIGG